MTKALNTELAFENAEAVLISRKEVTIDPAFQMREKMDHSVIDDYADHIEDLPPVHVFEVGNRLILTDGFHRFFAHEKAETEDIIAKVITGTREEAIQYAMAANFAHLRGGSKPSASDQKKAIETLCEAMMDSFGYSSKAVIPALREVGITASDRHLRNCTTAVRAELDAKRDAKIAELLEEGLSNRAVAKEVGVAESTVRNFKEAAQKRNSAESAQGLEEQPAFEDETGSPEFCGFDDEDDEAPVINPAEAQQEALKKFERQLGKDSAQATVKSQANAITAEARTPCEEVAVTLNSMVDVWKKHGKEALRESLTKDDQVSEANRDEFLKMLQFAAHLIG